MSEQSPFAPPRPPQRVSVIMAVLNGERTIERAVRSVLAQRIAPAEVIVVDDGSVDGTRSVVSSIDDPRLTLLSGPHRGVSAARNAGIKAATGELVTFLDCDDLAKDLWLETLTRLAAERGAAVACAGADRRYAPGRSRPPRLPAMSLLGFESLYLAGTYMVEASLLNEVGGFDEALRFSENFELGLRLELQCRERGLTVASEQVAVVEIDRSGSGRAKASRLEAIEHLLDVHRDVFRSDKPVYAGWLGMAAVEATRHGQRAKSVRYALQSVRVHPGSLRSWARLVLTVVPFYSRRRWGTRRAPSTR